MWQHQFAAVILLTGLISQAQAVQNDYATCTLIPYLYYNNQGDEETVTVGLRARASGRVYWQFYDRDGNRRFNTNFSVNSGSFIPLIWASEAPASLEGFPGYGLLCLDSNGDNLITINDERALAANVFLVQEDGNGDDDIAFIPALGLNSNHLASLDPGGWNSNPINSLPRGVSGRGELDIQFLINDGGEDRTRVFIWTTQYAGTPTLDIIDPNGALRGSLTLSFMEDNLTVFDMNAAGFNQGAGFLRWTLPASSGLQAFAFSIARAEAFGASQTLLGHARNP